MSEQNGEKLSTSSASSTSLDKDDSKESSHNVSDQSSACEMSLASKAFFGVACIVTGGIISYVHLKQNIDRANLHEGVIKDVERQQRRKAENLYKLQQQEGLGKILRREQKNYEQQSKLQEEDKP